MLADRNAQAPAALVPERASQYPAPEPPQIAGSEAFAIVGC